MPLITDDGFKEVPSIDLVGPDAINAAGDARVFVAMDNSDDPRELVGSFAQIELITIAFPSFDDGRGFSLAKRLRQLGYTGHLRAKGHLVSDQYPMARASGFDDVEIDDNLAGRQPENLWRQVGKSRASYRDKLAARI
ncbi:MAG: DUF934 domain-containing protein [Hyphomicrobiaceae bacterium]